MTTYGTDRLRRSLDNQRAAGHVVYEMAIEDMEGLVGEVEEERDHYIELLDAPLASDGLPLRIGETVWGQDGRAFTIEGVGPEFVWGRAEGRGKHNRLRPSWLTHEEPDSWEKVESAADMLDGACRDLMRRAGFDGCELIRAADLVARCKRLAGVE